MFFPPRARLSFTYPLSDPLHYIYIYIYICIDEYALYIRAGYILADYRAIEAESGMIEERKRWKGGRNRRGEERRILLLRS